MKSRLRESKIIFAHFNTPNLYYSGFLLISQFSKTQLTLTVEIFSKQGQGNTAKKGKMLFGYSLFLIENELTEVFTRSKLWRSFKRMAWNSEQYDGLWCLSKKNRSSTESISAKLQKWLYCKVLRELNLITYLTIPYFQDPAHL